MTQGREKNEVVLAVFPSTHGFGFAVFEGPESLVDWGVRISRRDKNRQTLRKLQDLIGFYGPAAVVIEDHAAGKARKYPRVRQLIGQIAKHATSKRIPVRRYSRAGIRGSFSASQARNKHQIAQAIAERFPELSPRVPPVRKPWMSEDSRMGVFDAVALAVTHFEHCDMGRTGAR